MAKKLKKEENEESESKIEKKLQRRSSLKKMRKAGKSIKGMLSRKGRKSFSSAGSNELAPSLPLSESEEEETVYGVDLSDYPSVPVTEKPQDKENESFDKEAKSSVKSISDDAPMASLQVIVLLMEPSTRRFELLQLEFDSERAMVGDVLEQVTMSVTEEALREQSYTGICNRAGVQMTSSMNLSQFCDGNDILLAIPDGTASNECARLAKPILSDKNVVRMLRSNGINCSGSSDSPAGSVTKASVARPGSKEPKKRNARNFVIVILVASLAFVGIKMGHDLISSPLSPGDSMAPGAWRNKCGVFSVFPSQESWKKLSLPEFADKITPMLSCESSFLEMGQDGDLTLYGHDKSVSWKVHGAVCEHDHPSCVHGLTIDEKGHVEIGGRRVNKVVTYDARSSELSPWPFVESPNLRVQRGRT